MTQEIKLPGNSSAIVEIKRDDSGKLFVKKSCTGKDANRLLVQANKQNSFGELDAIKAPKIFEIIVVKNYVELRMEYVNGLDFVRFTNLANKDDFIEIIKRLVDLLDREFNESTLESFPVAIWTDKVHRTIESCSKIIKFDSNKIEKILLENLPNKFPMGRCHGDLTFSNIIVDRNKTIYTFDFLDPPIESPYEDVAKFLQDAQFFWSLQKFNDKCDKTKIKIYWSYAAKLLRENIFKKCDVELLRKFQILGLMRIVPYTKDPDKLKFLENSVQGLLNDFDFTVCR